MPSTSSTPIRSYFQFSATQQSGIFVLLGLIFLLQLCYFLIDFSSSENDSSEKQEWLAVQSEIDSLKEKNATTVYKMYPFNPNFITDFKGYKLGMSVAEIDRLLDFRKTNRYVNSVTEFQAVTMVSDSLLQTISPYFKFPDWVTKRKQNKFVDYTKSKFDKKERFVVKDINEASQDDLIKIYGIGPALSERILKEKDKLGSFVSMEQMQHIWGLSPEVIENLNKYFNVTASPKIKKLKINDASVKELLQFPFFKYALAKEIVTYRSMNGKIQSSADLTKINGFPVEKINIIALYLEF